MKKIILLSLFALSTGLSAEGHIPGGDTLDEIHSLNLSELENDPTLVSLKFDDFIKMLFKDDPNNPFFQDNPTKQPLPKGFQRKTIRQVNIVKQEKIIRFHDKKQRSIFNPIRIAKSGAQALLYAGKTVTDTIKNITLMTRNGIEFLAPIALFITILGAVCYGIEPAIQSAFGIGLPKIFGYESTFREMVITGYNQLAPILTSKGSMLSLIHI